MPNDCIEIVLNPYFFFFCISMASLASLHPTVGGGGSAIEGYVKGGI